MFTFTRLSTHSWLTAVAAVAALSLLSACAGRQPVDPIEPVAQIEQPAENISDKQDASNDSLIDTPATQADPQPSTTLEQEKPQPTKTAPTKAAPAPIATAPEKTEAVKKPSVAASATADQTEEAAPQKNEAKEAIDTTTKNQPTPPLIADNAIELTQTHTLKSFSANYRIYVSKIPTTIKADLTLKPTKQADTWNMTFSIKSLLMNNLEDSTFVWDNCNPKSQHYHHEFKGFGKRHFNDTSFSWNPPKATNQSADGKTTFDIPSDAVDDLTVLLRAACVFNEGIHDFKATSIYGDEIRKNHFQLVREEVLKTAIGDMHTLVIEKVRKKKSSRQTLFWVAPELNYLLVKAKHIENSALFGEVILKKYDGPTL